MLVKVRTLIAGRRQRLRRLHIQRPGLEERAGPVGDRILLEPIKQQPAQFPQAREEVEHANKGSRGQWQFGVAR